MHREESKQIELLKNTEKSTLCNLVEIYLGSPALGECVGLHLSQIMFPGVSLGTEQSEEDIGASPTALSAPRIQNYSVFTHLCCSCNMSK